MVKRTNLLQKILAGQSDASIRFDDLRKLLLDLGFEERIKGSHHVFVHPKVENLINVQPEGKHAKPYQIRQVRSIILRYKLNIKRSSD
jgi:predicted RNA binding protein YcfA (HicA-like mRNA interferase family)